MSNNIFLSDDILLLVILSIKDLYDLIILNQVNKTIRKKLNDCYVFKLIETENRLQGIKSMSILIKINIQLNNTKLTYKKNGDPNIKIGHRFYSTTIDGKFNKNYMVTSKVFGKFIIRHTDIFGNIIFKPTNIRKMVKFHDMSERQIRYLKDKSCLMIKKNGKLTNKNLYPGMYHYVHKEKIDSLNSIYLKSNIINSND